MRIAFLGLGNMGSGIASCIRKAGYDLTVWNRTAAKADPLMAAGARRAATPREAVSEADIVHHEPHGRSVGRGDAGPAREAFSSR